MAHGDPREGKWRGNWRMEWVASTLHTTSEHGVSSITTADAHTSAASSRLNWCPCRFKWTRPFRRKTKSGFCARAITFQTQSTNKLHSSLNNSRNLFIDKSDLFVINLGISIQQSEERKKMKKVLSGCSPIPERSQLCLNVRESLVTNTRFCYFLTRTNILHTFVCGLFSVFNISHCIASVDKISEKQIRKNTR